MVKIAGARCAVAIDSPLTREELVNCDDHAENVWRLVVDLCSATKRISMPRRSSASYDDLCQHSQPLTPYQPRICVFTSEVDPHSFNCDQKTERVVLDKLPYSKHSIKNKLLTLLRRKMSGSDTEGEESENCSANSDRSPSPASVPVEPTPSGAESLAIYASNEPSSWKKVQAYVQKYDKCSIAELNGRFRKANASPSSRSKSEEPHKDRVRNFVFKSGIGPDKPQRHHSDEDLSKSFNEYLNSPTSVGHLQPSLLSHEGTAHASAYLASSILPSDNEGSKNLAAIPDLFATTEKEDIDDGLDAMVISNNRTRHRKKGTLCKLRHAPLISSVRSALERFRRRQASHKAKVHEGQLQYDDEPSLSISRSISIDVAHADILNIAV